MPFPPGVKLREMLDVFAGRWCKLCADHASSLRDQRAGLGSAGLRVPTSMFLIESAQQTTTLTTVRFATSVMRVLLRLLGARRLLEGNAHRGISPLCRLPAERYRQNASGGTDWKSVNWLQRAG